MSDAAAAVADVLRGPDAGNGGAAGEVAEAVTLREEVRRLRDELSVKDNAITTLVETLEAKVCENCCECVCVYMYVDCCMCFLCVCVNGCVL